MANELTISASFAFTKNSIEQFVRAVTGKQLTVSGDNMVYESGLSIATSETTINLGGLSTLGWAWFHNLDSTNFLNIKTGASGTIIVKIPAGAFAMFMFGSGVTAPVAVADTAACLLEYAILKP